MRLGIYGDKWEDMTAINCFNYLQSPNLLTLRGKNIIKTVVINLPIDHLLTINSVLDVT
ncbi:hypothetical protein [Spongiimicrobium sp. 3-5]|uniref:hypothetical protein n=1 Tax=Spongiimicrobium sp. 3-5 TaxID=3332596 RepID=UPI0039811427